MAALLHSGSLALALPFPCSRLKVGFVSPRQRRGSPLHITASLKPSGPPNLLGSWKLAEKSKGAHGRKQRKRRPAREGVIGSHTRGQGSSHSQWTGGGGSSQTQQPEGAGRPPHPVARGWRKPTDRMARGWGAHIPTTSFWPGRTFCPEQVAEGKSLGELPQSWSTPLAGRSSRGPPALWKQEGKQGSRRPMWCI